MSRHKSQSPAAFVPSSMLVSAHNSRIWRYLSPNHRWDQQAGLFHLNESELYLRGTDVVYGQINVLAWLPSSLYGQNEYYYCLRWDNVCPPKHINILDHFPLHKPSLKRALHRAQHEQQRQQQRQQRQRQRKY